MKAVGRIGRVELAIEQMVRKLAADNDKPLMALARENGELRERERRLLEQIAVVTLQRDQAREELALERQHSELLGQCVGEA